MFSELINSKYKLYLHRNVKSICIGKLRKICIEKVKYLHVDVKVFA